MERTLCILLSLMLAVTGLVGLCVPASAVNVGDIIEFGSYPQSRETNSATITTLNAAAPPLQAWESYGYYTGSGHWNSTDGNMKASDYMKYTDVEYGGQKYRGVQFSHYRPWCTGEKATDATCQDDNGYDQFNHAYWFKWEPLQWRVLDPKSGLVLCERIIDSQPYNNYIKYSFASTTYWGDAGENYYANDYAHSSIHDWLTKESDEISFLNQAFTKPQQSNILETALDNNTLNTSASQNGNATLRDKIFLLSWKDIQNTAYGFNGSPSYEDIHREGHGSNYARCQGLCVVSSTQLSNWWLRTACDGSSNACCVFISGCASDNYEGNVSDTTCGVRPAMRLKSLENLETPDEPATVDFHENSYKADIWLNLRNDGSDTAENRWLTSVLEGDYGELSAETYKALASNKSFQSNVAAWNSLKFVFNPLEGSLGYALNLDQTYDVLIADLIQKLTNNPSFKETMLSRLVEQESQLQETLEAFMTADELAFDFQSIQRIKAKYDADLEPGTWSKIAEKMYDDEMSKNYQNAIPLKQFTEELGNLMFMASNLNDFVKRLSAYTSAMQLTDSMFAALRCVRDHTSNTNLRSSLYEILKTSNYKSAARAVLQSCLVTTAYVTLDGLSRYADDFCNCIPFYREWRAVYQVGSFAVNLAANTQDIVDKYKLCEATAALCGAVKASVPDLAAVYKNNRKEENAGNYIAGVELLIQSVYLDLDTELEFVSAATEGGLINKGRNGIVKAWNYLWGNETDTTYEHMCKTKDAIVSLLGDQFTWMNTNWIFADQYLEQDYPTVYPIYAKTELQKDIYKPILRDVYLNQYGQTECLVDMPHHAMLSADGIQIKETAGGKTHTKDYAKETIHGKYLFVENSTQDILPRTYSAQTFASSSGGNILSAPSNSMSLSTLEKPSLDLCWETGRYLLIRDKTTSVYKNIKYDILRSTDGGKTFQPYTTVPRDTSFLNFSGNTKFEIGSSEETQIFAVRSRLMFEGGLTITAESDKALAVGKNYGKIANNAIRVYNAIVVSVSAQNSDDSVNMDERKPTLSWSAIEGADGYDVYRKTAYSDDYAFQASVIGETFFTDTTVNSGETYDYRIVAFRNENGNHVYEDSSDTVRAACNSVSIMLAESTITKGETLKLQAVTYPIEETVTWRSENDAIAQVDASGKVTAVAAGTVQIVATSESGIECKKQITVTQAPACVYDISVNDQVLIYKNAGNIDPTITADSSAKYTLTYSGFDSKIISVDANGKVTALKKGATTVTVAATDEYGNTVECTCKVTVKYAWWQWLIRIFLLGFIWY